MLREAPSVGEGLAVAMAVSAPADAPVARPSTYSLAVFVTPSV